MSSGYNTKLQTKPLKGGSANFVSAQIDNINASSLKLESLNVAGVFEDGIFMNVTIEDSIRNNVQVRKNSCLPREQDFHNRSFAIYL